MINVYVIQILLILFFGLLFREDKKKFLTAAFIVLFVVMAFRHARMVGYDSTSSYFAEFIDIQKHEISWPNPGLPLIMKAISFLNGGYQWVIIVSATWVCFAYYRLLLTYSENGFISVMWFMGMLFYTFLFSALKQAWAMAFLCFAFDAIIKKKPMRFVFLIVLATLFHFPALVFLPAYWIAKLKISRSFPILMLSILVIVFIFRTQILNLMMSTYSRGEGDYSSDVTFLGTKSVFMLLMLAYGFYQYFGQKDNTRLNHNLFSALLYYMGIAAVIQTFCFFSNNFERLADYYYHFSILYVPLLIQRKVFLTSFIDKTTQPQLNNALNSKVSFSRIKNYSIDDIDMNTVFLVVIAAFCIWRYASYMVSNVYLSPFYFFWQNVNISMRFS